MKIHPRMQSFIITIFINIILLFIPVLQFLVTFTIFMMFAYNKMLFILFIMPLIIWIIYIVCINKHFFTLIPFFVLISLISFWTYNFTHLNV
jgi:hypothetical protein